MWVWISVGAALVVALVIFGVAALRAWRQVTALWTWAVAVWADLESYVDAMQVTSPEDRAGAVDQQHLDVH